MKKWTGIFFAVMIIVLLVVRSMFGEKISQEADFGIICDDGEYVSQVVQCDNKDYVIYKYQDQQQAWVTDVDKKLYQYEAVGTVHYDRVYYLYRFQDNGQMYFGIEPAVLKKGEVWQPVIFEAQGTLFAAGSTEDEIYVSILEDDHRTIREFILPLYYGSPYEWEESADFTIEEGHYPVCGIYEDGELYFAIEDGSVFWEDTRIEDMGITAEDMDFTNAVKKEIISGAEEEWLICAKNHAAGRYLPLVLMVSVFIVFWLYGFRKENHFVYRLICYAEITAMLALSVLGYLFEDKLIRQEVLESGTEAGYVLEEMKLLQQADETIGAESYLEALKRRESFLEDLVIADPENGNVILAKTMPAGMNIYDIYGAACKLLVEQVAEGDQAVMMYLKDGGSDRYVVSSRNWTQTEAKSVLLAVIPKSGIEKHIGTVISSIWDAIYTAMLVITVIHTLIFLIFSARWKKFIKGMQCIAEQQKEYGKIPRVNDGLYGAWIILDRIGYNAAKLRYDNEALYRSYARFIPQGMKQLLQKDKLSHIEIGNHRHLQGTMAELMLVTPKGITAAEYEKMLMENMNLMDRIQKKYGGVFLSANDGLRKRNVFFEKSSADALHFALDFCHMSEPENGNVFWLLDRADCHYGISGVKESLVPFLYSSLEKVPDVFRKLLAQKKVKLVLTKPVLDALKEEVNVRYLGYVFEKEMAESIELYECLDAYEEKQKKLIKSYDKIFQKALELFVSFEFYQARNLFHEVLRMNEQDEIARWYFYRCSFLIRQGETYEAFSDDSLKQWQCNDITDSRELCGLFSQTFYAR